MARRFPRASVWSVGAVVGLVLATLGPTTAGATPGTSGNAAAIALYRAAAKATNDLPAYVISQHGYVRINDSIGKHRKTEWAWGQEQFQHGEVPTNERLVLVQNHGEVSWLEDTLRPDVKCDSGGTCPTMLPLQFFITKTQAFVGIVSSGTTAPCFTREPRGDVPYVAGIAWWFAIGSFAPIVPDGALKEVRASYLNAGQRETESDWVSTASAHFTRSTFRVAASSTHRSFRFVATYTKLRSTPQVPHVTICS